MPQTVLSNLERRTLGNLSIPRNVDDLVNHLRSHAPASAEQVDELLRGDLTELGWVHKIGTADDPAKLASAMQKHKATMDLPDEKADIYARRMLRPNLKWRMDGDLWMLTKEGLAELHKPPPDEKPPATPSEVQTAVDTEWARVHRGEFIPGETSLTNALLEGEFIHWFNLVADDCEQRWNVRPVPPIAGGASGWSDATEVTIIDWENQKTATPALVDPFYVALSILALTDADTGTTTGDGSHVPTYTGYARKSVAASDMNAASSGAGSAANANAITFAACTAGSSTCIALGQCSASTVGILRKWCDITSTVVSTTQTPATLAVGAYVTTAA
jgi:hypothetical protein